MHEMALMSDILSIVDQDAQQRGVKRITDVQLIVGDLSNALPDALEMAFLVFKKQGKARLAEDATLTIIREAAHAVCIFCGEEYEPKERIALCPSCSMPGGELTSGETFKVHSYETDE
ncbi:hydrogenase maturation nickel metallochaperone HypA [Bacillus tianshenii]|nr:hydrogenase maturation nickel metallochaperone HypA [Bacillus tianshenii]